MLSLLFLVINIIFTILNLGIFLDSLIYSNEFLWFSLVSGLISLIVSCALVKAITETINGK